MLPEIRARRLGRLSAAERVAACFDEGRFEPLSRFGVDDEAARTEDGLVVGVGAVDGRRVLALGTDRRCARGTIGDRVAKVFVASLSLAVSEGLPVVLLIDSDGVRIEEGAEAVFANGRVLGKLAEISGYVPMIGLVFGAASGAAAYALALCDLAIAVADRAFAFVAGPSVVRAAIGEEVSIDALGGTLRHEVESGLLHATAADDRAAIVLARRMLGYLPSSASTLPPREAARAPEKEASLAAVLGVDRRSAYDLDDVLARLVDAGSMLPLASRFGPSIEVGFARLDGRAVLIVASRTRASAGALDAAASQKLARFVRFAGAFNLPVLTLADTPGFMPGSSSERARILVHGAKVITAYAEARRSVPLLSLIVRRAVGAGSVLVLGSEVIFGLPGYELVAMGEAAASSIGDPSVLPDARARVDETVVVLDPAGVRDALCRALASARPVVPAPVGDRKHGLVPL